MHFEKIKIMIPQERVVIKMTKREHDELISAFNHITTTQVDEIVMIAIRGRKKGIYIQDDVFVPVEVTRQNNT